MKTYCEVERSMLNLPHETNTLIEYDIFRKCKEELDDDDDVQFVEITEKQPTFSFGFEDEESQNRVTNNVSGILYFILLNVLEWSNLKLSLLDK